MQLQIYVFREHGNVSHIKHSDTNLCNVEKLVFKKGDVTGGHLPSYRAS